MMHEVMDNLWFDSERLNIVKGTDNLLKYTNNLEKYNVCQGRRNLEQAYSGGVPSLIYMSALHCNLKCIYCYANDGTYRPNIANRNFKVADYIYTFDSLIKKFGKVRTISFFGGEPLLNYNEIKLFLDYVHKNYDLNNLPKFCVLTNGTIMNDEIKEVFKKYNVHIGSSLDGPKEKNDFYRRSDEIDSVYDKVVESLDFISELGTTKVLQFTIGREHVTDYKKNDALRWLRDFENLPITNYELIPATPDDNIISVLHDDTRANFELFCNDAAEYYLNLLTTKDKFIIPRSFLGMVIRIMKKEYLNDCSAGESIAITPDLHVYPCQLYVGNDETGVNFEEFIKDDYQSNVFDRAIMASREGAVKCRDCIGLSICPYWCKALAYRKNANYDSVLDERCVMIQIFITKIIHFLANDYNSHKETVNENLVRMNNENLT